MGVTPARIDGLTLDTVKGEERLHFKVADVARELPHPQESRVPALHRELH